MLHNLFTYVIADLSKSAKLQRKLKSKPENKYKIEVSTIFVYLYSFACRLIYIMKRRVKPFNELLRWQRNRRLHQSIDESSVFENCDFEEKTSTAIPSKEQIIENYQMENSFIQSQCTDFSDILQYSSDSSHSNVDIQEEMKLMENTADNNYNIHTI